MEIANGGPYGPSGAVWSGDAARAAAVARRLRAGRVHVNGAGLGPGGPSAAGGGPDAAVLDEYLASRVLYL